MLALFLQTHLPLLFGLLFLTGLIAGTVDTIAGGGGLLTVPVLMLTGVPPALVLGTNKLQSCFGSTTAAVQFIKKGKLAFREYGVGLLSAGLGGALGALSLLALNADFLEKLLPLFLIAVMVYMIISPQRGLHDHPPRISPPIFFMLAGLVLGFYDGFFGPGTGSFWPVTIIALLGYNIKKATWHAKICNAGSNIAALCCFMVSGHVMWSIGLMMALGQLLGARIGAHIVMSRSTRWIKPVFLSMSGLVLVSVLFQKFF